MAKFSTQKQQNCGIALGGIGTGSVELYPDGEFHQWQIYNTPRWGSCCREAKVDDGEGHTGDLSFWIRTENEEGQVLLRKLGMRTDPDDFTYRMFTWNKPVERIDFDGRFPICELDYIDQALPCKLNLKAIAPFVPHNADASAAPGFYLNYTVKNPTDRPLKVSLMARTLGGFMNPDTPRCSSVKADGQTVYFVSAPQIQNDAPDCGSLCLSVTGEAAGEITCIAADYSKFLKEYVSHSEFGVSQESFLFGFRESGRLPDDPAQAEQTTVYAPDPAIRLDNAALAALSDSAVDIRWHAISKIPSARSILNRIQHIYPRFPSSRKEKEAFLRCYYKQMRLMDCDTPSAFGAGALCYTVTLPAGGETVIQFVYSWYFPHHFSENGREMGHYYENSFADALEVNRFLVDHCEAVGKKAEAFVDLLFNTSLPRVYPECWSSQLSTLVKCSWWLKDGRFGIWEGLGYCGFHTTDITYHASFGLLALFPSLQLKQMEMGAAYQRADGRVHHFFTPDLYHVDDGFDRVDMNMQFVLMVCRDYLFTGDKYYLDRLWQPVIKALESIERLDKNGDGLPDSETGRNTYDAWHFEGTPSYIALLWLGALKAGVLLALRMEAPALAEKWAAILEKGKVSLEKLLWNGKYYDLWRGEQKADHCLMSDQLDGEWFLRMIGLEGNLPDSRVRQVLTAIWANNFSPETGLVNASCPTDSETTLYTYQNCQAEAQWTGIGYAFAALLLSVGMRTEALTALKTIHSAQIRFGHYWDHWECGYRYSRPLSSWSTLHSALGLAVDVPKGKLTLAPAYKGSKKKPFRAPLCLPEGIGQAEFIDSQCQITCLEGKFTLKSLSLPSYVGQNVFLSSTEKKEQKGRSTALNQPISISVRMTKAELRIEFERPLTICAGQTLIISQAAIV